MGRWTWELFGMWERMKGDSEGDTTKSVKRLRAAGKRFEVRKTRYAKGVAHT